MRKTFVISATLFGIGTVLLGGSGAARHKAQTRSTEYDFRGATLGMSLSDFRAMRFPDADKSPDTRLFCSSDPEVHTPTGPYLSGGDTDTENQLGVVRCAYFTPSPAPSNFWKDADVFVGAQGLAKHVSYKFVPDPETRTPRLYRILIHAYSSATLGALDGLKGKFGPPTATQSDNVQNGFGAKFPHAVVVWKNTLSEIVLEVPSGDMDTMSVAYSDTRLWNYVQKANEKAHGPNSAKM